MAAAQPADQRKTSQILLEGLERQRQNSPKLSSVRPDNESLAGYSGNFHVDPPHTSPVQKPNQMMPQLTQ